MVDRFTVEEFVISEPKPFLGTFFTEFAGEIKKDYESNHYLRKAYAYRFRVYMKEQKKAWTKDQEFAEDDF